MLGGNKPQQLAKLNCTGTTIGELSSASKRVNLVNLLVIELFSRVAPKFSETHRWFLVQ